MTRIICGFITPLMYFIRWRFIAVLSMLIVTVHADVFAAEKDHYPCRDKLSKNGLMIFDEVQQKRTPDSNLEGLWKEVTRDLISGNILGREEATPPAMEALNCLRDPQ